MSELVVIITGNFFQAVEDWRDKMEELHQPGLSGKLKDGRDFRIISVDSVEHVRGLEITSYTFHHTAIAHKRYYEMREIMKTRVRPRLDVTV